MLSRKARWFRILSLFTVCLGICYSSVLLWNRDVDHEGGLSTGVGVGTCWKTKSATLSVRYNYQRYIICGYIYRFTVHSWQVVAGIRQEKRCLLYNLYRHWARPPHYSHARCYHVEARPRVTFLFAM